jgi:hypothetical protein
MVGQLILVRITFLNPTEYQTAKLHGIEMGGLWLECQSLTDWFLSHREQATAPITVVAFVPYAQILCVLSSIGSISLSEKAFGV